VDGGEVELGYGPHTLQIAVEDLCHDLDPLLVQRKGRLIMLASEGTDPQTLAWVCQDYYMSRSFDAVPTLVRTLSQAYRDHPGLEQQLYLLVVQRGLDLSMVGNSQAIVRLARYSVVRDLFDPQARNTGYRVSLVEHDGSGVTPRLYSTTWRVVTGDVLLYAARPAAERISEEAMARVARRRGTAAEAARSLGRSPGGHEAAPFILARYAQLSAVPEVPAPVRTGPEPTPQKPPVRRQGTSPVLIAGLIALLSVALWAVFTDVHIDPQQIPEGLHTFFFPEPTPTLMPDAVAGEGEDLSTLVYGAPVLVAPYNGARVTGAQVALVWDWSGDLAEGERFEVTVQPPGREPPETTLTREARHTITRGAEGWYTWTVRVVDATGEEGSVPLSPRAEEVSFHWGATQLETPEP